MKKSLKSLLTVAGLLSVPIVINRAIFNRVNRKIEQQIPSSTEMIYHWKYGQIRYVVSGQGNPLVLVHGIGAGVSLYEWQRNIPSLSKHYRVYALDLLGFGYSDKPNVSYSSYLYITLINDFIRDVVGAKANVIASSNSGAYALTGYIFEPELYKKLFLVSPTGIGASTNLPSSKNLWGKWLIELPIIGTTIYNMITSRFYCAYFLKKYCYANCREVTREVIDNYYNSAHYGGASSRYPIAAFISNFLNVEIESKLSSISIPLQIVWGEQNQLIPVSNLISAVANNPNITPYVFKNSKLLPHVDDPSTFYRICRDFFE